MESVVCQESCSLVPSQGWLWSFHLVFPVPGRIVCQNTVPVCNIVREWRVKPSQISSVLLLSVRQLNIPVIFFLFSFQILWTFSIYLESVAILPQLFMISKTGEAETITTHYLFFLGLYRALYLVNWIWRYYFEGFFDLIAVVAGVVQTVLYCDFFYLYVTKGK